jgi:hypothetical protein
MFLVEKKNDAGVYAVKFFIRGKPWVVHVDSDMVFKSVGSGSYRLLHAGWSAKYEVWAPIVEKAWAKVKGSYLNSEGGLMENGFRALTGAPVFTYDVSKDYKTAAKAIDAFTLIDKGDSANYIMAASTKIQYSDAT